MILMIHQYRTGSIVRTLKTYIVISYNLISTIFWSATPWKRRRTGATRTRRPTTTTNKQQPKPANHYFRENIYSGCTSSII